MNPVYELGGQYTASVDVCPIYTRPVRVTWTAADTALVRIAPSSDSTALVLPLRTGTTQIDVQVLPANLRWTSTVVIRDQR